MLKINFYFISQLLNQPNLNKLLSSHRYFIFILLVYLFTFRGMHKISSNILQKFIDYLCKCLENIKHIHM